MYLNMSVNVLTGLEPCSFDSEDNYNCRQQFLFLHFLSVDCVILKSEWVLCSKFWLFLDFSCKKKIEAWYLKYIIVASEEKMQLLVKCS